MTPDPVYVTDEIEVQDAVINFDSLHNFERGKLRVDVEEVPDYESAFPVPADEDGDTYITGNGYGLFWGFKDGEVQPPADTSPHTKRVEVPHESEGTLELVPHLDHVVHGKVDDRDNLPRTMQVTYGSGSYGSTKIPTSWETIRKILERYVAGPLGSEYVSRLKYMWNVAGKSSWASAKSYDEDQLEKVESIDPIFEIEEGRRYHDIVMGDQQ